MRDLIHQEIIERKILLIRGKKIMMDRGLAKLYGVPTKRLNAQVKRNIKRFPDDFMFQLNKKEKIEISEEFIEPIFCIRMQKMPGREIFEESD